MSNPNIPTPHITAKEGDFARTVLMPGDPLRSKFIAETYLENPVLVNDTRGVQGYTGLYHGKRVSVMASGMGIPSIGIYSYELFNFYGVENIIRVGTAGGLSDSVNVRDVVIGLSSYTNSNFGRQFGFDGNVAPCCSFKLLEQAVCHAAAIAIKAMLGLVCDPIAGLVEVPCVKRNAAGAVIAMSSADMALAGIRSAVPPDEVILAMREVGDKMDVSLKETGVGGVAGTPFGQKIAEKMGMA